MEIQDHDCSAPKFMLLLFLSTTFDHSSVSAYKKNFLLLSICRLGLVIKLFSSHNYPLKEAAACFKGGIAVMKHVEQQTPYQKIISKIPKLWCPSHCCSAENSELIDVRFFYLGKKDQVSSFIACDWAGSLLWIKENRKPNAGPFTWGHSLPSIIMTYICWVLTVWYSLR